MSKLTSKQRHQIPSSEFGLPKQRKYPMEDRSHAIDAKARAKQQFDRGNLTPEQLRKIDKKANRILGKDEKNE